MKDNESQCIIKLGDSYNKRILIQKQNSFKNKKKYFFSISQASTVFS